MADGVPSWVERDFRPPPISSITSCRRCPKLCGLLVGVAVLMASVYGWHDFSARPLSAWRRSRGNGALAALSRSDYSPEEGRSLRIAYGRETTT